MRVIIVNMVEIGTSGSRIPKYPPIAETAVSTSVGKPEEEGNIENIPFRRKYAIVIKKEVIMFIEG